MADTQQTLLSTLSGEKSLLEIRVNPIYLWLI